MNGSTLSAVLSRNRLDPWSFYVIITTIKKSADCKQKMIKIIVGSFFLYVEMNVVIRNVNEPFYVFLGDFALARNVLRFYAKLMNSNIFISVSSEMI